MDTSFGPLKQINAGVLITNLAANQRPVPPKAEWVWWYQY